MVEVVQVVNFIKLLPFKSRIFAQPCEMKVLPMHGSLPASEQMKIFERTSQNVRKIVVATNIAEASVTIPGTTYVIDTGFVKLKAYNPQSGIESLVTVPISQASANQRAGKAGRVRAGKAYRLYTEESYEKLLPSTVPEMQRSDLAPVILQLKALGVANILRFHFLSPPPAKNMIRGLELLYALGAIDAAGNLTSPLGLKMAEFPLTPQFSKMLLSSGDFGCSEEAIIVAAMSQIIPICVPNNIITRVHLRKEEEIYFLESENRNFEFELHDKI
ncbi:ATPdependent RNA helicase [Bulinus truncatus]|nr:ATPdependent RNA helicase [Bulinus truncatus]